MKVMILCGGLGTRLREETEFRPKPMVPIGDRPILWHIMKYYAHFGHKDFVLCLGYKGEMIKDFFFNYKLHTGDVTLNLGEHSSVQYHTQHGEEDWKVTLVDTGANSQTGGRIKRALKYIDSDHFLMTYGDGLCNSDVNATIDFHQKHGGLATVTAVPSASRFGELNMNEDSRVTAFMEKSTSENSFISGGFFVLNRKIKDYIKGDETIFEKESLVQLASENQLHAYKHFGYWSCMDTPREVEVLNRRWKFGMVPWKVWETSDKPKDASLPVWTSATSLVEHPTGASG